MSGLETDANSETSETEAKKATPQALFAKAFQHHKLRTGGFRQQNVKTAHSDEEIHHHLHPLRRLESKSKITREEWEAVAGLKHPDLPGSCWYLPCSVHV